MACLRESPPEGRRGIIHCDEEGCEFRYVTTGSRTTLAELSSEADCLLQLRLRARDLAYSKLYGDMGIEEEVWEDAIKAVKAQRLDYLNKQWIDALVESEGDLEEIAKNWHLEVGPFVMTEIDRDPGVVGYRVEQTVKLVRNEKVENNDDPPTE